MPRRRKITRKRSRRRRVGRRRGGFRRGNGRIRMMRAHHRPTFWFNQASVIINTNIVPPATGDYTAFINLSCDTLLGSTPFFEAFDFFRVLKWQVSLTPLTTQAVITPSSANPIIDMGEIITYIDYNGGSPPTGPDVAKAYANNKITRGNRIHRRSFTPACLDIVFRSGTAFSYEPRWRKWLRTLDRTTPFYGMGIFFNTQNTTFQTRARMQGRALIQFYKRKNPLVAEPDEPPIGILEDEGVRDQDPEVI